MKPEMERYEWVVIRHPELASAVKTGGQEGSGEVGGQNSDGSSSLQQPERPAGELSPFLAARHFNLNSRNTSMFMAGSFDSIIVGEWPHRLEDIIDKRTKLHSNVVGEG